LLLLFGCKTIVLKEARFIHPQKDNTKVEFKLSGYQFNEHQVIRTDQTLAHGISMTRPGNQFSILFFGGNKFLLAKKGEQVVKQLGHFGADIYIFDHRGYGLSSGTPTLRLLMQDAIENFDYVRSKTVGTLILHGHSMGSFEAGWVAKNRAVDALVLESTVTHVDEWVKDRLPRFLKPFIRFEIKPELRIVNNIETVKQLTSPLLLLVGGKDNLTPPSHSRDLYELAKPVHKFLHVFKEANHVNVRSHHYFNTVYQTFIDLVLNS